MADEIVEKVPAATETGGKRTRGKTDPNLKKQRENPLDGDLNGVKVAFDGSQYQVSFEYSPVLVNEMRGIEGASFNKEAGGWVVPLAQYDALAGSVTKMRDEMAHDASDLAAIKNIATETALKKMQEQGFEGSSPRLTDFHPVGKPLSGEIISVNGRYAAQLTGFGRGDGAAFVTLHRVAELSEQVFKGDKVTIAYGDKGKGKVEYRKSLEEKLDESMGKYIDGVKVVEVDGKYKVSFDYNPALSHRIQRIDGAEFNREEKVWEVAGDKKEFVARAVNDMRKEVIADRADREQIEAVANEKIDGAKVKDAFTKDGTSYTGKILAANDRYVLQHSGKEYATVHRAASLPLKPEVGQNTKITYQGGKGQVADRTQSKSQGQER